MSENILIPTLDALIFVLGYLFAAYVLMKVAKKISQGTSSGGIVLCCLTFAAIIFIKGLIVQYIDKILPGQAIAVYTYTTLCIMFITAAIAIYWKFAIPIRDTLICSILATASIYAVDAYAPIISKMALPDGPRLTAFMSTAKQKMRTVKEKKKDLNIPKPVAAPAKAKSPTVPDAVPAPQKLSTITGETTDTKDEFAAAVDFIAERQAQLQSWSPEEKEAYKSKVAAYMVAKEITQKPQSLNAIDETDPKNIQLMADFIIGLQNTLTASNSPERELKNAKNKLKDIVKQINAYSAKAQDERISNKFTDILSSEGIDSAIASILTDLESKQGKDPVASAILVALIESGTAGIQLKAIDPTIYREKIAKLLRKTKVVDQPDALLALEMIDTRLLADVVASILTFDAYKHNALSKEEQLRHTEQLRKSIEAIQEQPLTDKENTLVDELVATLSSESLNAAIEATITNMQTHPDNLLNGIFIAALIQAKSGLPVAQLIHIENERAKDINAQALTIPIKQGVIHLPIATTLNWEAWSNAFKTIKVNGFIDTRTIDDKQSLQIIIGSRALSPGEQWKVRYEDDDYLFKVDAVERGWGSLTAVLPKQVDPIK